jgi:hypothetical protein
MASAIDRKRNIVLLRDIRSSRDCQEKPHEEYQYSHEDILAGRHRYCGHHNTVIVDILTQVRRAGHALTRL